MKEQTSDQSNSREWVGESFKLTSEQKRRYNRHLILDGFGMEGQRQLLQSKVLIVGAGGLGSPAAMYLAAAGVGTIGLVDGDFVSSTNLQRQILYSTSEVGQLKIDAAERRLKAMNPDVNIVKYEMFLNEDNALDLIRDYDFVLEGTDNFASKYLVNDACVMLGKSFTIGGINRYGGQVMTHLPDSACYRCLFPEPPAINEVETCSMVGVLGSLAGMVGTVQATEAIKCLTGIGVPLTNALLTVDALTMRWNRFDFNKNNMCELCGEHPSITSIKEYAYKPCAKRNK